MTDRELVFLVFLALQRGVLVHLGQHVSSILLIKKYFETCRTGTTTAFFLNHLKQIYG